MFAVVHLKDPKVVQLHGAAHLKDQKVVQVVHLEPLQKKRLAEQIMGKEEEGN